MPQPTKLHLFPFSLPGELHASQAARFHRDSGNANTAHTYETLYEATPFRLTQWIPTHIEKFAGKIAGSLTENVQSLLRKNTLFPLLETFCGTSIPDGQNAVEVARQISALPKRLVGSIRETNLCIECLKCDREQHETSYIHRAHQAPGTFVCWKHQTRLLTACPHCHFPFEPNKDLILAAWDPCPGCKKYLADFARNSAESDALDREIEIAKFGYELLQSPTRYLSGPVLAQTYRKRIEELGLMRKSTINRVEIVKQLDEHFGDEFLSRVDRAHKKGKSPHWFVMCSSYAIFEAPLSRHILLANFLYPEAELFMKAAEDAIQLLQREGDALEAIVSSVKPSDQSSNTSVSVALKPKKETRTKNRSEMPIRTQILEVAQKYQNDQIKNLWKCHPRLMKMFLREDPSGLGWLQKQLDGSERVLVKSVQFASAANSEADIKWAKAFANSAIELYGSVEKPLRVTKSRIMKLSGWRGLNPVDPLRMPMAHKQLDSLPESEWHYWARRIVWALMTMECAPTSASSVRIRAGVEHQRGVVLADYFRGVRTDQVLWAGKVMDTLMEYGIDRNWQGPDLEREFYRAGRGYKRRTEQPNHAGAT
jgi:hypothetical protein